MAVEEEVEVEEAVTVVEEVNAEMIQDKEEVVEVVRKLAGVFENSFHWLPWVQRSSWHYPEYLLNCFLCKME